MAKASAKELEGLQKFLWKKSGFGDEYAEVQSQKRALAAPISQKRDENGRKTQDRPSLLVPPATGDAPRVIQDISRGDLVEAERVLLGGREKMKLGSR